MKQQCYIILLAGLLLISFMSCNNDEGTDNGNDTKDSNLISNNNGNFEKQNFEIPLELKYTRKGQGFIYDKLFPIGWSKDGKFAYIKEPADEGSGFYWFEIYILDIVNNKVSWLWKSSETENDSLQSIWKDNYELFAKHLNEAEIVQSKFDLKATNTSYKGNDYELVLEAKTEADPDLGVDMIREYKLNLVSPELGKKQFYDQKIDPSDYVFSAYVPGYLMSPHDDRIVVICQIERMGFEGPPNVVSFELIGSDLIRGFKKENEG